eukprot:612449-Prymnesium_polylepis.1
MCAPHARLKAICRTCSNTKSLVHCRACAFAVCNTVRKAAVYPLYNPSTPPSPCPAQAAELLSSQPSTVYSSTALTANNLYITPLGKGTPCGPAR